MLTVLIMKTQLQQVDLQSEGAKIIMIMTVEGIVEYATSHPEFSTPAGQRESSAAHRLATRNLLRTFWPLSPSRWQIHPAPSPS